MPGGGGGGSPNALVTAEQQYQSSLPWFVQEFPSAYKSTTYNGQPAWVDDTGQISSGTGAVLYRPPGWQEYQDALKAEHPGTGENFFNVVGSGISAMASNPLIGIALSLALPGIGSAITESIVAAGLMSAGPAANLVGMGIANASLNIAKGQDPKTAIKNALISGGINYVTPEINKAVSSVFSNPTLSSAITNAGTNVLKTAASGGNDEQVKNSLISSIANSGATAALNTAVTDLDPTTAKVLGATISGAINNGTTGALESAASVLGSAALTSNTGALPTTPKVSEAENEYTDFVAAGVDPTLAESIASYKPETTTMAGGTQFAWLSPENLQKLETLSDTDTNFWPKFDSIMESEIALGDKGAFTNVGDGKYAQNTIDGVVQWAKNAEGNWDPTILTPKEAAQYESVLPAAPKQKQEFFDKYGTLFSAGTTPYGYTDTVKQAIFGPGASSVGQDTGFAPVTGGVVSGLETPKSGIGPDFSLFAFDTTYNKDNAINWVETSIAQINADPNATATDKKVATDLLNKIKSAPVTNADAAAPSTDTTGGTGVGGGVGAGSPSTYSFGPATPQIGGLPAKINLGAPAGSSSLALSNYGLPSNLNTSNTGVGAGVGAGLGASPLAPSSGTKVIPSTGQGSVNSGLTLGPSAGPSAGPSISSALGPSTSAGSSALPVSSVKPLLPLDATSALPDSTVKPVVASTPTAAEKAKIAITVSPKTTAPSTTNPTAQSSATAKYTDPNAIAGKTVNYGQKENTMGYNQNLKQLVMPELKKWDMPTDQELSNVDLKKALSALAEYAPNAEADIVPQIYAEGGPVDNTASFKDLQSSLKNLGNIDSGLAQPKGQVFSLKQVGVPPQQHALQQMNVIPQLAALLQSRGMRFAEGGQPDHAHPHYDGTPLFRTGGLESLGGRYVEGKGDGTSDNIAAMLANGEYVFSADVVAALGNGSNKAGAKKLDEMVQSIRARARSAPPDKLPPDAKSPLEYLKSSKGAKHG